MGTTPKNKAIDAKYLLNQLKNLDKDILETKYVQEKDVKDTYTATDENPISGKGVAVAVNTLQQDINKKSNIGHKHTKSEITDFPTSMTPTAHNQASNTINAMTDYSKATSVSAITPTDTLNVAIGKLEKALDSKGTSSFSGSYNDLTDKPTIPSLDGYAKTSEIPSKVSELTNDSNYQTAEQVSSTVTTEIAKVVADAPEDLNTLKEMSDWIAGHENDASAMNSAISDNKTAITALQTGKADKSEIPTTVSELTDSADYAKTADVNDSISTLQTDKADASDLTAHTGDSVIHVTAENKTLWNTVSNKVNKEDGKALLADTDKTNYDDAVTKAHTHENKEVLDDITSDKVTAWDNKSDFSGSYNDLNDKPTIDAELSNTSENAIQNKVVTKEINKLYSDISFNNFDTATSGTSFTDAEDGNMLITDWTRNLLNPTLETTTKNGVTCTNNGDGTYTLNGTASNRAFFILLDPIRDNIEKYEGLKLVGCPEGGGYEETFFIYLQCNGGLSSQKILIDDGDGIILNNIKNSVTLEFIICVNNGVTCDNVLIKPMLTTDLSATYDDFVPYGGYEIQSCGKNLLNVKSISLNKLDGYISATIENGSTFILNGKYELNVIDDIYFDLLSGTILLKKNKKYIFSADGIVDKINILFRKVGTYVTYVDLFTQKTKNIITPDEDLLLYFNINFTGQIEVNNLRINVQIEEVSLDTTEPTEYEPYTGESIQVTNDTESPAFGLKSHKGITNIISPGNVKCVYPTNESGKGVLDSLYNKDKMLTEQNESLSVIGKCKNLLKPTLQTTTQDGITCTNNGDCTYTLNGTCSVDSPKTTIILTSESMKIDENVKFICCTQSGSSDTFRASVDYDDGTYSVDYGEGTLLSKGKTITKVSIIVSNGATVNNLVFKPMLTTNLSATYDDFVPYTGDGDTLASDVTEIKNDLGGLTFSASGTTLTITNGTNTWTLEANS